MAGPSSAIGILEAYWAEQPSCFGRSYGESLQLGANQELLRLILRRVELGPGMRALEVSCALGGNARWLAGLYGLRVDAVDASKAAIQSARQLAKAQGLIELCHFQVARADQLPFADGTFDLAVTAEGDASFPELARVLHPGALLVGSAVAAEGLEQLGESLHQAGFEVLEMIDVSAFARAFYKGKEEEAKLLLGGGLLSADELVNIQMQTVDLYEAGGASHGVFKVQPR